jgi:SAM-dependent methyltransferase
VSRNALAAVAMLPVRSRILDVGCGNGVPVTEALVNAGYRVVGLDFSAAMLARFQANLPGTSVVPGDARLCPFVDAASMRQFQWG